MISRSQKATLFGAAQQQTAACTGLIIVHYSGLDVATLTELRVKLKDVQAQFKVIKNRVFKKALQEQPGQDYTQLLEFFKGPVGIVFLGEDVGAGVKVVSQFAADHDAFAVQTGYLDQSVITPQDLSGIAELPSLATLQAQILAMIVGVHRQLLGVLSAVPRDLVGVLAAIEKTKK